MVSAFVEYLFAVPVYGFAVWSGLAILVILIFMREPGTLTLASDASGKLQISRHALHRLVEACCEQLNGVASARATVTRRGGKFCTTIRLKVRPDAKLEAIRGYLTEEIADVFRQNLGIKAVGAIDIQIVGAASKSTF